MTAKTMSVRLMMNVLCVELSLQVIIIREDGMIDLELNILTGIPPALLQE